MEENMKKRFNEDQIHKILKESESGVSTPDVCRKYGISANTFYRWRSKYGGMELNDLMYNVSIHLTLLLNACSKFPFGGPPILLS
ncbi:transposase [Leptospira wolffii serovar Khorat str. Khorat-H2]|nr:transposase [Leptospira wolffii serovar Khorat str. Khorat-H2]